jgi:hypothetical protein
MALISLGLMNHGAASRQRSGELVADEAGIGIPRRDETHHADRLHHHLGDTDAAGERVVLQRLRGQQKRLGRVLRHPGGARHRAAVLLGGGGVDVIGARSHRRMQAAQQRDAFGPGAAGVVRPGAFGRGDGPLRVFPVAQGDVADDGLGGGIDEFGDFLPMGGDESAVDVDPVDGVHGPNLGLWH